MSKNLDYRITP